MVRGSGEGKLEMGTEGGVSLKRSRETEWAAALRSTPLSSAPYPSPSKTPPLVLSTEVERWSLD